MSAPLRIDDYIAAATASNTRRSYQSAIAHFEIEWGGFLPASADSVARYLATYAQTLALNTLRQRLAAIAQWHNEQGFPDPTKAPLVKKTLKGIQTLHPEPVKQAKPFQLSQLEQLVMWLDQRSAQADTSEQPHARLKAARDKALVLMGFWRGFRSDELGRLRVEHIHVLPNEGMTLFVPYTKTERSGHGMTLKAPALSRLCPVAAYQEWITLSGLREGAVFRRIDRWGQIAAEALHPNSFIPLLRDLFVDAGIADADTYSSHSLRRGFATWANANGWDIKMLMEYVGWKDMQSALRYIEAKDPFARERIEQVIQLPVQFVSQPVPLRADADTKSSELSAVQHKEVELHFSLERQHAKVRGKEQARKVIETCCLKNHGMQLLDPQGYRYRLFIQHANDDEITEVIDGIIDDMHQIAATHSFFIDAQVADPASNKLWT